MLKLTSFFRVFVPFLFVLVSTCFVFHHHPVYAAEREFFAEPSFQSDADLPPQSAIKPALRFTSLTTETGLSYGVVTSMLQDQQGFIWIDTESGLNRYDGYSFTYNLIEDASNACGLPNGTNGNIIGSDPNLGALANNGGETKTHALLAGSPAIDAGTNIGAPSTDQRGENRADWAYDIGAFEMQFSDSDTVSKTIAGADTYTFGPATMSDDSTINAVTRSNVTAFSPWTAGNQVGPTAVRLQAFTVSNAGTRFPEGIATLILILLPPLAIFSLKNKSQKSSEKK